LEQPRDIYFLLSEWKNISGSDQSSKTPFFYWNRYKLIDTIGNDLIENSTFTNNFDGWENSIDSEMTMLLDNSTPLDGGCVKLIKKQGTHHIGSISTAHFVLDSGQYYMAAISNYSIKNGNTRIYTSMFESPFLALGLDRYFPFDTIRNDYSTIFQANQTCDNSRLEIVISDFDSIAWVDNISIYPVSATYEEPTKKSRLFLNATSSPLTFDLGDSIFYNLDHQIITSQLTVEPYSSQILIFDSSLILHSSLLYAQSSISVFPNPVGRNQILNLRTSSATAAIIQIEMLNMQGAVVFRKKVVPQNQIRFSIPSDISAGIYLLRIIQDHETATTKIFVAE